MRTVSVLLEFNGKDWVGKSEFYRRGAEARKIPRAGSFGHEEARDDTKLRLFWVRAQYLSGWLLSCHFAPFRGKKIWGSISVSLRLRGEKIRVISLCASPGGS